MKHITESVNEKIYTSPLLDFYFHNMSMGTLDIETTGLNPERCKFVLGGLYDFDGRTMHQFFADSSDEEADTLLAYFEKVSCLDVIITYNGRHFDLPFMETRYRRLLGDEYRGKMPFHLDLYLLLSGHSPVRQFVPNLKQKTVENYLGLWEGRTDEISGAESIELYYEYVRTGSSDALRQILLHNRDDVIQLSRLLKVISKSDWHKGMNKCGFPAGGCTVSKTKLHRDVLEFSGVQLDTPVNYRCFQVGEYPASSDWNESDRTFRVKVPVIREHGLTVIDLYASGIDTGPFEQFPAYSSGFLAVETSEGLNYMEINRFIISFMDRLRLFMDE